MWGPAAVDMHLLLKCQIEYREGQKPKQLERGVDKEQEIRGGRGLEL